MKSGGKPVPLFLQKLYAVVSESRNAEAIGWSESGQSFVIRNADSLSRYVLPVYYKHNNFASFVRQLNMYRFRKVSSATKGVVSEGQAHHWEFTHDKFVRGRPELLSLIQRKSYGARARPAGHGTSPAADEDIEADDLAILRGEIAELRLRQDEADLMIEELKHENTVLHGRIQELERKQEAEIDGLYTMFGSMNLARTPSTFASLGGGITADAAGAHSSRRLSRPLSSADGAYMPGEIFDSIEDAFDVVDVLVSDDGRQEPVGIVTRRSKRARATDGADETGDRSEKQPSSGSNPLWPAIELGQVSAFRRPSFTPPSPYSGTRKLSGMTPLDHAAIDAVAAAYSGGAGGLHLESQATGVPVN